MMDKVKISSAIDTIEHRLKTASKDYHNTQQWDEVQYMGSDPFVGTYQEWIEDALDDLRDLLGVGL
jgi:hypothetical protein